MKKLLLIIILMVSAHMLAGQTLEAERLPDMNVPRAGHNVFYVNGELTVVGGHTSGFVMTPTAEYFSEGAWHTLPTVYNHDDGMAVVMSDGKKVLLAGGHDKNLGIGQSFEAEMYNSETHTSEGFGSLDRNRALAQGIALDGGRVLIAGNHKGNDGFEIFDGKKFFHNAKDITVWRSSPYLLPIANGEVIYFGTVWRGRFEPCDTVDRLNGEPFTVPLLKKWMPFLYDMNSHACDAFIGDKAAGDYSYLVAAKNIDGEVALIHIKDTVFSLLPTTFPIPTKTEFGNIKYDRPVVADRKAKKAYLVGSDTTNRVYVVAVDYDKQPAHITLYYNDPLPDFGDATPVLTPDGDLIIAGGITDDNFAPFASVWLLHTGTQKTEASVMTHYNATWLWLLCGLLFAAAIVFAVRYYKLSRKPDEAQDDKSSDNLMERITELMETNQVYLNPELKVSDVADALGVHRNAVSSCINKQKECSFNQFVNEYRVQHAMKLMREASDKKISAIRVESGFASDTSFFRIFKAATGMTPKEWDEKN